MEKGRGGHHQGQQEKRAKVNLASCGDFAVLINPHSIHLGFLLRHTLMVSPGDFGLYSCHANNKLGGAATETLIAVEV